MSNSPSPHQQDISGVSAQNGSQVIAGIFKRDVHIGSHVNPQKIFEEKATRCLNALDPCVDPNVDREKLISSKGTRVTGTCEWVRENEAYKSWLQGDALLLWISGGPGKGKTMLSIFLTEELEEVTQGMEDTGLVFYFCSHRDEKRNTAVAVLRGLVHQIVKKRPKLIKFIQDDDLGKMFCVLDGLDECDEGTLRVLVPRIVDMFSSRNSQPAIAAFKLVIERVTSDIERFISKRVGELSRIVGFDDKFRATVQETLLRRSEGTFLWVGFVMNELSQQKTCIEVLRTLETFPSGLPAIYSRMLLQIKGEHRRTSSQILRWVTMAVRPLTLQELAAAIGMQSSSTLITTERAIRDHVALCGLFLKVQEQEVGLVHQSARDYLLRKEPDSDAVLEEFRIKPEAAQLELLSTCLDCIAHSGLQHAPLNRDDLSSSQESPLLEFRKLVDKKDEVRLTALHLAAKEGYEAVVRLLLDYGADVNANDLYRRKTALHLAAGEGYEAVVRLLLDYGADVNAKDKDEWTALHWVAQRGYEAVIRLLLDYGVDVNVMEKYRRTALHLAAKEGYEAVVRLLLDYGADVNAKDKDKWTALHWAAPKGHEAAIRVLLDHGVEVNAKNTDGVTALQRAAGEEHEEVVQLLRSAGAS
ncbi:hypothetical protein DL765_007522 [Monosporascus sp. GIB2]|nr:hypothetical protein DL765_007522 [Monosporascus sp. GIB2]